MYIAGGPYTSGVYGKRMDHFLHFVGTSPFVFLLVQPSRNNLIPCARN